MQHILYKDQLKREKPDFVIKYRIINQKRLIRLPGQGIRTDFMYAEEPNQAYIIYPEFRDEKGSIILDTSESILVEGIADMWVIMPEMIDLHKSKLELGKKGYLVEGTIKMAECEIISINR